MHETVGSNEFFDTAMLKKLSPLEQSLASHHYRRELLAGLAGQTSSVKMFPSLLSPVDPASLKEGQEALVVEIGGTNLYGARVQIQDGKPVIIASHEDPLKRKKFDSVQDFYETIAGGVEQILRGPQPSALGIVYSFPGEAVRTQQGVDVRSPSKLTKDFEIPGIQDKLVGKAFKRVLQKYGLTSDLPTVVLNDTVAVLFSRGSKIGGVVGSGFNLAMQTNKGIVNSESGGFAFKPTHRFAQAIYRNSGNVGNQLAEKQIAGLYLGQQMEAIVEELGLRSLLPKSKITGETVTTLLEYKGIDSKMLVLNEAAQRLRNRSAQIVGVLVGTAISTFPDVFAEQQIDIPVEGSLFWKMPEYKDRALDTAQRFSQKELRFLQVEKAGRIGAAVAALSFTDHK